MHDTGGFRLWNMCNIQAGLTVLNQTDTAKRMEKNRLYFSWYVDRVNILFILFSILKCSHLPRWTLVSLHTYSCQKEVMVMTNQTNHHPSLNTTLSLPVSFFFFFCPLVFFIKPSVKPQTLLINTHWKKGKGRGGMRQIHVITVNRRKTQYRGKQNNTLTKKEDIKPMK